MEIAISQFMGKVESSHSFPAVVSDGEILSVSFITLEDSVHLFGL